MLRKKAVIRTYPAPALMQGPNLGVVLEDNPLGSVYLAAEVDKEIESLKKGVRSAEGLAAGRLAQVEKQMATILARDEALGRITSKLWAANAKVLELRADLVAMNRRIKELEGVEAKLIETSGQCFQVADRHMSATGDMNRGHTADWLEGRLKRLAELEARDEAVVPAYWKDRARRAEAQLAGLEARSRRFVPWRSIVGDQKPGDAAGLYEDTIVRLAPATTSNRLSNLEEITGQLLTVGEGVDTRLGMLDEDVERAKLRETAVNGRLSGTEQRLSALEKSNELVHNPGHLFHGIPKSFQRVADEFLTRLEWLEKDGAKDHKERKMLVQRVKALEGVALDLEERMNEREGKDLDVSDLWRRLLALESQAKHQS